MRCVALRAGCTAAYPPTLHVAARCGDLDATVGSWSSIATPCVFHIRYMLLPAALADGARVGPVPIGVSSSHYYHVDVGEYDVMRFDFRREGRDLTLHCGPDCVTSAGHGILGTLAYAVEACPTLGATERAGDGADTIELTNMTIDAPREFFCTGPGEGGSYVLGLHTAALFDPLGPSPGYALPNGQPPLNLPPFALVPNPTKEPNFVRKARGYYSVSVTHYSFTDGALALGEARRGCIAYGQWRHFSLVGFGASQAHMTARVEAVDVSGARLGGGMPISALYVRLNRRPTPEEYDGEARVPQQARPRHRRRRRCRRPSCESPECAQVLSLTPCDVDEAYQYHFAAALDTELHAQASPPHEPPGRRAPALSSAPRRRRTV